MKKVLYSTIEQRPPAVYLITVTTVSHYHPASRGTRKMALSIIKGIYLTIKQRPPWPHQIQSPSPPFQGRKGLQFMLGFQLLV